MLLIRQDPSNFHHPFGGDHVSLMIYQAFDGSHRSCPQGCPTKDEKTVVTMYWPRERELFVFLDVRRTKGCEQKLWTFVRHSCKLSVCFLVVKKNNGTGSNGQIVGVHSWWHLCCWELIQQSSRMKPFVPACGIVKHWLGMTRLETITKPQPALLSFNDFARFFSNPWWDMSASFPESGSFN